MKTNRTFGLIALSLAAAELLIILGSWMVVAAFPELPLRSLISFEGVRWLFGGFTECMDSPLLVWIILLAISFGALTECKILQAVGKRLHGHALSYREKTGLWIVLGECVMGILLMLALTCLPHALLLNSMGHLYPSAFSTSLVPTLAFALLIIALSYGATSGRFTSLASAYHAMTVGLIRMSPCFPIYVLLMQVVGAVKFVLG